MKWLLRQIKKYPWLVAAIILLCFTLPTLARYSFWFDESYTSAITDHSARQAIELTAVDVHPPLYYIVMFYWRDVFGSSDIAMRSLSVVFGVAALIFLYKLLARLFERRTATVGTIFASLGPFVIRYSQEARMYTLVATFILASTYVLVVLMQRRLAARSLKLWVVYGLLITACVYTHYFSSLILVPHLVYIIRVNQSPQTSGRLKRWLQALRRVRKGLLVAGGISFGLFLPWLPTFMRQIGSVNNGFWIPQINELSISNLFGKILLYHDYDVRQISSYITLLLLVIFLISLTRWVRKQPSVDRQGYNLLLNSFWLPVLILFLISAAPGTSSYFYVRYFAQYAYFFYGLIGVVVWRLITTKRTQKIGLSLGMVIIIAFSIGISNVLRGVDKRDNSANQTFQIINQGYKSGDVIVALDFGVWFDLNHYNLTKQPVHYLYEQKDYGSLQPIFRQPGLRVESLSELEGRRIWLAASYGWQDFSLPAAWGQPIEVANGRGSFVRLYELTD
ncbi:glycosyltransferase family 39 protein [Candidatus Saccharibacteria bacterium]|nr:glycosyltransferase family 39 protein [Candidatus Saccharibacteria bacterium]MCB9821252.1 glycosyltransferase family 39 protein [Candidatus Nomurabacteria bacterium]